MAIAAADFTMLSRTPIAPGLYRIVARWVMPASYTAGGEPLTNTIMKARFGINQIKNVSVDIAIDVTNSKALKVGFDNVSTASTQGKLRAFADGGAAANGSVEIAGGVGLSAFIARMTIDGV
jgi:hypothetical protein